MPWLQVSRFSYILNGNANTCFMPSYAVVIVVTVILLCFLMPIRLKLRFLFDFKARKLFYSLNLANIIRVNSGYVSFGLKKAVVHMSDAFAVVIEYGAILSTDNGLRILKIFKPIKMRNAIVTGGEYGFFRLLVVAAINSLNAVLYALLKTDGRLKRYGCDVYYTENEKLNYFLNETVAAFSLARVILVVIKSIFGGKGKSVEGK